MMIITRTPFRVSFFGGGTDYPEWFEENGGSVIATSINKYCYITARYLPPFFEHKHRIVYSIVENVSGIDQIKHPVVREVLRERNYFQGVEVHHDGDLPARSGLGSSSSFTVGIVHALNALEGKMSSKKELAHEAIRIERELLGENVGYQDQITTAYGGFNRVNFSSNGTFEVLPIITSRESHADLQDSLILFFTGITRFASDIAGEQIMNMKSKSENLRIMGEMVDEAISIFQAGNITELGKLLDESWKLKKSLASGISLPQVDEIYEAGRDAGALGGKLLGAGGGGFMLFVVQPENRQNVIEKLKHLVHVDFQFETAGSKVIVYEPDNLDSV